MRENLPAHPGLGANATLKAMRDDICFLGKTNFRGESRSFGIRRRDRRHHIYKVGHFLANPALRRILGHKQNRLRFREIMDEGQIFLANVSKGRLGEDTSALLGALLLSQMERAALSRADIGEEKRQDFYLYVDEFQNVATPSFAGMLSESRKYALNLTLCNQFVAQL